MKLKFVKIPPDGMVGEIWWVNPYLPLFPTGNWLINFYKRSSSWIQHIHNVKLGSNKKKPEILFQFRKWLIILIY